MSDPPSNDSVTANCLGVRVDSKSIQLTIGGGTTDLQCPNEVEHFGKIDELIKELSISLVTVVANNGLEGPLVEWLRDRGVETVVLELPSSQPSLIDKLVTVSEGYESVKVVVAGIAAVVGGVFVTSLGLQADQNGNPMVPGGIWKGSAIILLGVAFLAIYLRKLNREANASQ